MPTKESLKVVLNTSQLIILSKLGILKKALELFDEVEIPSGVLEEISRKKNQVYREVMRYISERLLYVEDVKRRLPRLGLGESSAILLALNKNKIVALDDKNARRLARELGLEVIGTLSILKKLYEEGALAETPSSIYRRLIELGFYIEKKLFDKIFEDKTS